MEGIQKKVITHRVALEHLRISCRVISFIFNLQNCILIIIYNSLKCIVLDYPNLKDDTHRLEHFSTLCEVLKEYMGEANLPNAVELLGIYGRVSRIEYVYIENEQMLETT